MTYKAHEKVLISKNNMSGKIDVRFPNWKDGILLSEDVKEFEDFDQAFRFVSDWLLQNFTATTNASLSKKGIEYFAKIDGEVFFKSKDKFAAWAKVLIKRFK